MSSTTVTAQTGLLLARNQPPQSSQFQKSQLCTWALLLSAVGNHEEAIENGALK